MSIIYKDGTITDTGATYEGKFFFRKMFYYSNPVKPSELHCALAESDIVKILMEHPHPNIVTYYRITPEYIDMEKVDLDIQLDIAVLSEVKDFLQNLGIVYMDWKLDNIGKSGTRYKLFDFDASGIVVHGKWVITPAPYWAFKNALKQGLTEPFDMDNWAFHQMCTFP